MLPGDHVRGNPRSAVVLVEYADFESPYCAEAELFVRRIAERYRDDVAVVFRPFPLLQTHPHALHAAQAAEAAGAQGKFWEMHDAMLAHQDRLEDSALIEYASNIGLDMTRFRRDFESRAVVQAVGWSIQRGINDGVTGTPTFFLNCDRVQVSRYEDLQRIVARTLDAFSVPEGRAS